MTIQLATAAAGFKTRDRVVVRAAPNEWYTGAITRVGVKSISVKFDDGATSVIQPEDFAEIKAMLVDYKSDTPINDVEAKQLYSKGRPPRKFSVKVNPPEPELGASDAHLLTLGDAASYAKLRKSKNTALILRWMAVVWRRLNSGLFKNEMHQPIFNVLPYSTERATKVGGVWKAMDRHLCIGISKFDGDELHALKTLHHLMCHQAVSEIDKMVGVGHGPAWGIRMYNTGHPVYLQVDPTHDVPYMLQFEPDTAEELPNAGGATKAVEENRASRIPFKEVPMYDTPVEWVTSSGQVRLGLMLGQYAVLGIDEVTVLLVPSSDKYKKVPLSEVFVVQDEDRAASVRGPMWRASAARVAVDLSLKPGIRTVSKNSFELSDAGGVYYIGNDHEVAAKLGMSVVQFKKLLAARRF